MLVALLLDIPNETTWGLTLAAGSISMIIVAIHIAVLLRYGLVALFVSVYIDMIEPLARASDWTLWHTRSAWLALAVVAAIAAYGYWAAARPSVAISESR